MIILGCFRGTTIFGNTHILVNLSGRSSEEVRQVFSGCWRSGCHCRHELMTGTWRCEERSFKDLKRTEKMFEQGFVCMWSCDFVLAVLRFGDYCDCNQFSCHDKPNVFQIPKRSLRKCKNAYLSFYPLHFSQTVVTSCEISPSTIVVCKIAGWHFSSGWRGLVTFYPLQLKSCSTNGYKYCKHGPRCVIFLAPTSLGDCTYFSHPKSVTSLP